MSVDTMAQQAEFVLAELAVEPPLHLADTSHLGSAFVALYLTGSDLICHLDPSVSNVTTIYLPCIPLPVVFLRALFLVLCFSSCTPLPSALSSLPCLSTTTFMQMTLFFSFHPPDFDSNITHLQNALQL